MKMIPTYRIPMIAEHTDPQLGPIVHLAHWVQNRFARAAFGANHRIVGDRRQIQTLLDRLIQTAHGHHHSRGIDATGRPDVPRKPDAISVFVLLNVLLVRGHCC